MNILQMSFYGAVLILIITALRAAAKNGLPKKTFLILWGIAMLRLLVPYDLPSEFSVYSWLEPERTAEYEKAPLEHSAPFSQPEPDKQYNPSGSALPCEKITPENETKPLPKSENKGYSAVFPVIWLSGAALLGAFFTVSYLRCNFEFKTSLPVENDFIKNWLKEHKIRRRISVRQSDKITAPLTYGFFRPVILISKNTDTENTKQLRYMLLHEYVHICRFDSLLKLVCVFTLCLHWFNPAVWLMYFLFNRDIELACDESTVKKLGLDSKAEYARMLIAMEEKKSGLAPLCSGFGKNSVKERILAIMKIKKLSVLAAAGAVVLTAAVTVIFATSAKPVLNENSGNNENLESGANETKIGLSNNSGSNKPVFSESDFDKMLALKFDGMEQMSIAEFQDKVWKITDTDEYRELFERFGKYESSFDTDNNETADFIFNTLFPLTREGWQRGTFEDSLLRYDTDLNGYIRVEYDADYIIHKPEALTVGEYMSARTNISKAMEEALDGTTYENYINDSIIKSALSDTAKGLTQLCCSESFNFTINTIMTHEYANLTPTETKQEPEEETRVFPNASQSDYDSLLKLKTPNYREMPLKDFNALVLDWVNEDFYRHQRIDSDICYDDFTADLSAEEKSFVTRTFDLSQIENGEGIISIQTGEPEKDPTLNFPLIGKEEIINGFTVWCDLYCGFSYHISDKGAVTVGQRDESIGGMIDDINEFWNKTDVNALVKMTNADIEERLEGMAKKHSGGGITIFINSGTSLESIDERALMETPFYFNSADPEEYKIYAPFGLTVNTMDYKLYYNGKLVRCFDDKYPVGLFSTRAFAYREKTGVVDVRTVREDGKLIGLEALSEEEFRNREVDGVSEGVNTVPAGAGETFIPYAVYGLEYDNETGALFYEGERVRLFWDSLTADLQPSGSEMPFAASVSNWDGNGSVDLYVLRDYKNKDGSGYGKITGLRIADKSEFDRDTEIFGNLSENVESA